MSGDIMSLIEQYRESCELPDLENKLIIKMGALIAVLKESQKFRLLS